MRKWFIVIIVTSHKKASIFVCANHQRHSVTQKQLGLCWNVFANALVLKWQWSDDVVEVDETCYWR